eukprot:2294992-Prymnesium_polylepis.1
MWWTDLVFIKKTSKHLPTQPSEFTYSSRARCRYVKNPNDKECSEYKAAKAASSGASTAVGKVAGKAVSKVAGKAVGKVAGKAAVSKARPFCSTPFAGPFSDAPSAGPPSPSA